MPDETVAKKDAQSGWFRFELLPGGRRARIRAALVVVVPAVLVLMAGCFMRGMPGSSYSGPLPELTADQSLLAKRLEGHVVKLAKDIGERNMFRGKTIDATVDYINAQFRAAGYEPRQHVYEFDRSKAANVYVDIPGSEPDAGMVLIGAHYDSVDDCPGANDNASGVAAMLELARAFAGRKPKLTIRFVAFANEEPPFFQSPKMGSAAFLAFIQQRGEKVSAMLALETLGCYSDVRGSQKYPGIVGWFYPSRGNFVAFVGDTSSRPLARQCVGAFRARAKFPSEGACLPGKLPGIRWSDHWAYELAGIPAIMITDTAPFRYPHYHTPEDTPDKLDYGRLARVTDGLVGVIENLAGLEGPPAGK